jgi:hypothetical protein
VWANAGCGGKGCRYLARGVQSHLRLDVIAHLSSEGINAERVATDRLA